MKSISSIQKAIKVNMGGVFVDQAMPLEGLEAQDPFLLIHHWKANFLGDQKQKDVGVGPHPHRGFSPVTIIYQGALHHRDSLGNSSVVQAGGVQWMFAGKGVTHSERPAREIAEQGGVFEIIQFWVNAPASKKMQAPQYFPLEKDQLTRIEQQDSSVQIDLIAGTLNGTTGPIEEDALIIANLKMDPNSNTQLDIAEHYSTLIYMLDGNIVVNGNDITEDKSLIVFDQGDRKINIQAKENSRMLLLSGKPLEEEVVSYGPFVLNNTTQILEAIRDAQSGKMGILIEEFD
ncbi:MAG: pirin family protein [Saprospiraceae bacterium]|nr:pirin family protein [Saprospiraceae bacterium]